MMNRRHTLGSRPRSIRLSSSACTTVAFSVAPSITPRGCLSPAPLTPTAASSTRSSAIWMPSIWITSRSSCERSEAIHSFMRSTDKATKRREAADLERPAPLAAGTSPSGRRMARPNLRVETLISIRFSAHLPSQSSAIAASQLGSATSPPSRARTRGRCSSILPPWEAQLSLGPTPTIPVLAVIAAIADAAQPSRVPLHYASQRRDARRQAESLEARSDLLPSLFDDRRRDNPGWCGRLLHGVALLRGFSTPSLPAQGGQRLPHIFNIDRDIPSPRPQRCTLACEIPASRAIVRQLHRATVVGGVTAFSNTMRTASGGNHGFRPRLGASSSPARRWVRER